MRKLVSGVTLKALLNVLNKAAERSSNAANFSKSASQPVIATRASTAEHATADALHQEVRASPKATIWPFINRQSLMQYKHELPTSPAASLRLSGGERPRSGILRTVLFCTAGSAVAFTSAALWEESNDRRDWQRLKSRPFFARQHSQVIGGVSPAWVRRLPLSLQEAYREYWQTLSPAQQVLSGIIAVNAAVFAAFHTPSLLGFMRRNFIHSLPPFPTRSITLLTSNFAHITSWEAARSLGVEQFLGFYLSAGLMSALGSHVGRARSTTGGFSIGASGAVYACFALTAMQRPDTEVAFIFLPMLPLNIGDVLSLMMAVDLVGALLGWKRLDHLGHLGGALFGLYYALRGQHELWPQFQGLADRLRTRKDD